MRAQEFVMEKKWSAQRKRSINCARPRGFSQKAHCAGRKKNEDVTPRAVLTTKKTCARTRAAECACESVNQITESAQTVTAICVLEHSDRVKGTILMKQQPDSPTLIVGKITGLRPGLHGFHIHEFGDLSRGCESAGQHYNPDETDHGDIVRGHVGDLGNITADAQGTAEFSIVAKRVDLMGDRSVVGRAIVVHENQDDLGLGGDAESLKTGNAGDRLACGVITLKQTVTEAARVARKPGQPAGSKKHSDLYTDENPRGTIHGLKFATPEDARASVSKIRSSGRSHAHKIQAAVAMEQRARVAGKATAAGVYRKFINAMKKKTTQEQLSELTFRGSECTTDCSGHRAGHEWYGRNGRTPVTLSPSFNKGAAIAAAGQ